MCFNGDRPFNVMVMVHGLVLVLVQPPVHKTSTPKLQYDVQTKAMKRIKFYVSIVGS